MNLALLEPDDFLGDHEARVTGRRLQHLREVLAAQPGDSLPVGRLNGPMGTGQVERLDAHEARLRITWDRVVPTPLPLTLVLGLPRPKMMRRVLQTVAAMGVKRLVLLHSYKVDKSYWQTPWLAPETIKEQLVLGLEQAMDTALPEVTLHKRFKPFVEDELAALAGNSRKLVAHPNTATPCPMALREPVTLCIGPEGGFIPYEVEKLQEQGFDPVHLGARILRVETAVPALLARLFDHCSI
ncbi:16S rRNA (uracil(1498)-N(3))-methyltransferase [Marinobacteraceae bacterium S3BR75-40.1]